MLKSEIRMPKSECRKKAGFRSDQLQICIHIRISGFGFLHSDLIWPRRVTGNYFIQVGQGVFASVSTRTFHWGGVALACCLAQRSSASASAAGSSSLGGGGGTI